MPGLQGTGSHWLSNTMNTESAYRYAVYFMPALHTEWWTAGCHWLGRCAVTGRTLPQPGIPGFSSAQFQQLTQEPRRYGWHATLKAPFQLDRGHGLQNLRTAMLNLANELPAFEMPALQVSTDGGFLALRPAQRDPRLHAAADACVTRLHHLVKPLGLDELTRRRQAQLSPTQDRLLMQWAYPWVLEEFKFHLSLTGPLHALTADEREALWQAAQSHFETLPLARFEHLTLFAEPHKGADFQWVESMELKG